MSTLDPRRTPPTGIPTTAKCGYKYVGCTGDGTLSIDPYEADIHNHNVWTYSCDNCYGALYDGV